MEHIKIPYITVSYPVGNDIDNCKQVTGHYINGFIEYMKGKAMPECINLWCMGSSGSILAAMFALSVNVPCHICHIKKKGESSHSNAIQCYRNRGYNIIIDDFISSGQTVENIIEYMIINDITADMLMVVSGANEFKDRFDVIISSDTIN